MWNRSIDSFWICCCVTTKVAYKPPCLWTSLALCKGPLSLSLSLYLPPSLPLSLPLSLPPLSLSLSLSLSPPSLSPPLYLSLTLSLSLPSSLSLPLSRSLPPSLSLSLANSLIQPTHPHPSLSFYPQMCRTRDGTPHPPRHAYVFTLLQWPEGLRPRTLPGTCAWWPGHLRQSGLRWSAWPRETHWVVRGSEDSRSGQGPYL